MHACLYVYIRMPSHIFYMFIYLSVYIYIHLTYYIYIHLHESIHL